MRIVFMGTPDFAVGTLQALVESGKHEIAAVVTQPDRPKGRGQKMLMTPVKEYALSQGLPVYQPAKVKTPEVIAQLRELRPEIIVVAAFGQLLNQELLAFRMRQCTRFAAAEISRCGTDPLCDFAGRKRIRRNDHADGYRHGYWRYSQ